MKISSKGLSTRYDNDLGGNHLDRIRERHNKRWDGRLQLTPLNYKTCGVCGELKPRKGGDSVNVRPWRCADCKNKVESVGQHNDDTPLIKRVVTADRGKVLLTTYEVTAAINGLAGEPFTTRDIAARLEATRQNIDRARIEYSVRASIHWLVSRGRVRRVGEVMRDNPNCFHYPVTLYQSVPDSGPVDFDTLYRSLGVGA